MTTARLRTGRRRRKTTITTIIATGRAKNASTTYINNSN
jgi:hypothetical protein